MKIVERERKIKIAAALREMPVDPDNNPLEFPPGKKQVVKNAVSKAKKESNYRMDFKTDIEDGTKIPDKKGWLYVYKLKG